MAEMRHQGFGLGPETLDVLRGVFHEAWAEFEARFPAGMDSTAELAAPHAGIADPEGCRGRRVRSACAEAAGAGRF